MRLAADRDCDPAAVSRTSDNLRHAYSPKEMMTTKMMMTTTTKKMMKKKMMMILHVLRGDQPMCIRPRERRLMQSLRDSIGIHL